MLKVGLLGYGGRMGRLIDEVILEDSRFILSSVYIRSGSSVDAPKGVCVTNDFSVFLEHCEVVVDFSSPIATSALLEALEKTPRPLVVGTTGLSPKDHSLMERLSQSIPIVYATNTSRGIALLNELAYLASQRLRDADIEIIEIHHHHKKDAPSGTAMTLAETCAQSRGLELDKVRVSGRDGAVGARGQDEIGVLSVRGGDIVGKHCVGLYCDGEYLELTHNATSRKTFAKGAIEAVRWVVTKQAGLYNMKDVLE
ncbi:4-hydroxy-tetrahydrodipicolinate reductase [Helicobacter enhydrae]|uniref:4-hydroxy-tetrahydrodipicolinate reductase n=1 Tax=Helicobacter enhydrae TaxID=222136 RepID=A0A1B1U5K5_9HELI|nr:4-hydroxy-tetrahydrodipicolinate reductase [Helicobacter enhydrae]ANV98077.1 4-hydroxy-tetrahydrodipicolinate reductase [Helicobacter enhydrae]